MILALRRHLYATNIIAFFFIMILQKFIQIFCIIEEKACGNKNCTAENRCDENCEASKSSNELRTKIKKKQQQKENNFKLMPISMRKTRNFGFGEGHFQIFVEEKQRYQPTSEARLNAVDAELKLNPN